MFDAQRTRKFEDGTNLDPHFDIGSPVYHLHIVSYHERNDVYIVPVLQCCNIIVSLLLVLFFVSISGNPGKKNPIVLLTTIVISSFLP